MVSDCCRGIMFPTRWTVACRMQHRKELPMFGETTVRDARAETKRGFGGVRRIVSSGSARNLEEDWWEGGRPTSACEIEGIRGCGCLCGSTLWFYYCVLCPTSGRCLGARVLVVFCQNVRRVRRESRPFLSSGWERPCFFSLAFVSGLPEMKGARGAHATRCGSTITLITNITLFSPSVSWIVAPLATLPRES